MVAGTALSRLRPFAQRLTPVSLVALWLYAGAAGSSESEQVWRQLVESPVAGRIKRWHVQEGAKVKAGDLLVELSDVDQSYAARLAEQHARALPDTFYAAELLYHARNAYTAAGDAQAASRCARSSVVMSSNTSTDRKSVM